MVGSIFFEFFGILWEFSIFKVSGLFTLLKSADILHSKSQLITKSYLNMEGIVNWFLTFSKSAHCLHSKSYLNMEGIDLFVKILVFVKILSQWRRRKEGGRKCEKQAHRT